MGNWSPQEELLFELPETAQNISYFIEWIPDEDDTETVQGYSYSIAPTPPAGLLNINAGGSGVSVTSDSLLGLFPPLYIDYMIGDQVYRANDWGQLPGNYEKIVEYRADPEQSKSYFLTVTVTTSLTSYSNTYEMIVTHDFDSGKQTLQEKVALTVGGLPVTTIGGYGTGHGGFAPRPIIDGSDFVFIGGQPVHAEGDDWGVHCVGPSCHISTMGPGADFVFIEGRSVARIADPVLCGSLVAYGSNFVFCE